MAPPAGGRHSLRLQLVRRSPGRSTALVAHLDQDRNAKVWLHGDDAYIDSWNTSLPFSVLIQITIRDVETGNVLWDKRCDIRFSPSKDQFKFLVVDA
jgi:hypothetical protein